MTDPKAFKTGREFAAWIGLVLRQNSTVGKERLGSISKQGDSLPAATIGHQCNIHCQDRAHAAGQISLGDRTAGSSAYQGGRGGAGQQHGADRLGCAGQLSGTGPLKQRNHRSGGLKAWHRNCL
jgi:hypothetical protein